jgi:hypothetical protein
LFVLPAFALLPSCFCFCLCMRSKAKHVTTGKHGKLSQHVVQGNGQAPPPKQHSKHGQAQGKQQQPANHSIAMTDYWHGGISVMRVTWEREWSCKSRVLGLARFCQRKWKCDRQTFGIWC